MRKAVLYLFVLLVVLQGTSVASFASFMPTDFKIELGVSRANYLPGEAVTFLASIQNLSAETMSFGSTIRNVGMGLTPSVGGQYPWDSPYVDGYGFTPYVFYGMLDGVSINPGSRYRFPVFFVDTATTIPLGTEVALGPAFPGLPSFNMYFINIPTGTPGASNDPNFWEIEVSSYDTPTATISSVIPTPEPSSFILLLVGGSIAAACGGAKLRRR